MIESKLIIQSQLGYSFVNTKVENANSMYSAAISM